MRLSKKEKTFFYSMMNQYYIDRNIMDNYFKNIKSSFVPYRPLVTLKKYKRFSFIIQKKISFLFFIFYFVFIFSTFILYLFKLKSKSLYKIDNLFFDYSTSSEQIIDKKTYHNSMKMSVLYQYITLDIIFQAMVDSIKVYFLFSKFDKKYPGLKLQFLMSFKWFATYHLINKYKINNILFVHHYDRWATLISGLNNVKIKKMYQHGIVLEHYKIYKKISVDEFHYFNKESLQIFKKNYIDLKNLKTCVLQKNKFEFTYELSQKEKDKYKILFIGQPQVYSLISQVINKLESENLIIFIKPHPLYKTNIFKQYSSKENIILLKKTDYPKVNLAIYESSTLGLEYNQIGVNTFKISTEDSVNQVLYNIQRVIGNAKTK